jgi:hypothetical protein
MRRIIGIFIQLIIIQALYAQDVQFKASAPAVVQNGEQFQLTYTFNQQPSSFSPPKFDYFNLLTQPVENSFSSSINGRSTYQLSYTYYLQAGKEGKFTIQPAKATIGGKIYSSNALNIEVVKGAKPTPKSNTSNNKSNTDQAGVDDFNNEDLFIRVQVDKNTAYSGEAITATLKIYFRINWQLENASYPTFAGFFKNDLAVQSTRMKENVNGQAYYTQVLQQVILYPQKSGELLIDPYKLNCIVQQTIRSKNGSIWDEFFEQTQNVRRSISSKPIKLTIKPLPLNKPPGFNGAVGDFAMKVNADKSQLKENDALTIKIEINGTGNIKLIESPRLNLPPDFESYDPKITSNITASGNSGNKVFEFLAIPRHSGKFRIPPVEFSYFNPSTGSYKSLSSSEYNISVGKADESQTANVVTGVSREDLKFIGNDIRFIKTENIVLLPVGNTLAGSVIYYVFFPVLLLMFLSLAWFRRKKIRENADLALVRNRQASRIAKKRLKLAEKHLHANQKELFYDELLNAIYGYLSDKLRISFAELSIERATEQLQQKGMDESLLKAITAIVDRCQYARYAPSDERGSLNDDYESAVEIISKLEQNLR